MHYGIVLAIIVLLLLFVMHLNKKEHITEQAYSLTSRGLNLMNTDNSYLGGLAVLNAVENANTVSSITPKF
jgi:hypothetical protein